MAPKPGCIPLRPLLLGEILSGSFSAISRNARTVFGLTAVIAIIQAVISLVVQSYAGSDYHRAIDNSDPSNPKIHWAALGKLLSGSFGGSLLSSVFAAVLTGMLIVVVTEDVVGRTASVALVWSKVRSRIWRLVVLSLLVSLVSALALVFCIAPGVWLWGIWAVAVPALVIENGGIVSSLGRSRSLVSGMFWRVWGIRALGYLIGGLIAGVVGGIFTVIAGGVSGTTAHTLLTGGSSDGSGSLPFSYLIIAAIGTAVAVMLSAPIQAAIDSLLYVDLRMRKENLAVDLQRAAALVQRPQAG
ncbi:MAG: hypothetical protein M3Y42_08595 [Actinomycetota bacterium]|nr:hypothetical protein [Actinomycetota bacterium]MDQ2957008.1 hypothetical protein [Actinomycetota bacterium]